MKNSNSLTWGEEKQSKKKEENQTQHKPNKQLLHKQTTKTKQTDKNKTKQPPPTFLAPTRAVQPPLAEDVNPADQFNLYCNRMPLLCTNILAGNNDK